VPTASCHSTRQLTHLPAHWPNEHILQSKLLYTTAWRTASGCHELQCIPEDYKPTVPGTFDNCQHKYPYLFYACYIVCNELRQIGFPIGQFDCYTRIDGRDTWRKPSGTFTPLAWVGIAVSRVAYSGWNFKLWKESDYTKEKWMCATRSRNKNCTPNFYWTENVYGRKRRY
jgi:hypothetical protein